MRNRFEERLGRRLAALFRPRDVSPVRQGFSLVEAIAVFVIAGLQVLMLAALLFVGMHADLGFWYYASVAIAGGLMAYHQWLARDRQPAGCFAAFLHNHIIGLVIFIGIVLHYAFNPV
ncbi:MAG: hypothetical protein IIA78_07900 [Proteobacteria bacterium]|nr:hypothetical protein [Pseudomonadota bacterium]